MTDDNITDFPTKTPDPEAPWGRKANGTPRKPNAVQQRHLADPSTEKGRGAGSGQWGGPAKGAGNRGAGPGRMSNGPARAKRLADKQAAADEALAALHEMGMDDQQPGSVRVAALNSVIDRVEGKAIQRVAATPGGETVEELRVIDAKTLDPEQRAVMRQVIKQAKEG